MKIAITGKGGVGKTTFSSILSRMFAEDGYRVVAVDADPDANLALALGFPKQVYDNIVPISEMKNFVADRTASSVGSFGKMFKLNPKVDDIPENPILFQLSQNYPNPFNPSTKISWQSPVGSWQTLKVYDVLGREVVTLVDEYRNAGSYEVEFQSSVGSLQLASGIYYYQLKAGDFIQSKKMILMK